MALLVISSGYSSGYSYYRNPNSIERFQHGYTLVLPGIDTANVFDSNLAQGLKDGGVETAVEVDDWTTGNPLLMLIHLRHLERNKREARRIAGRIVRCQDTFPGRPVYMVGHSAGGGVALLTLEALPPDRNVTAVILLAAAVSPDLDLAYHLSRTEAGIWNLYSPLDVPLLMVGTTLAGTVDGRHTAAAGAVGFQIPADLGPDARRLYRSKLRQVPYDCRMSAHGNFGGHFGSTGIDFSREYIAPIIRNGY